MCIRDRGICPLPSLNWSAPWVYAPSPHSIGPRQEPHRYRPFRPLYVPGTNRRAALVSPERGLGRIVRP
eukprot:6869681-Pyramimonas_sp.AAC.1